MFSKDGAMGKPSNKKTAKRKPKDFYNRFCYSQGERNFDLKNKHLQKIEHNMLERTQCLDVTGTEATTQFSDMVALGEGKSAELTEFKTYIEAKELFNLRTREFYQHPWFRKKRQQQYPNRRRSEDQMINQSKNYFGLPSDVVIGFGDRRDADFRIKSGEIIEKAVQKN
ncbi:hypothetical protein P9112_004591 [Eukaryota sp. TZLM1-RC]